MTRVDLFGERIGEKDHFSKKESEVPNMFQKSKDINKPNIKFGHPSVDITQAEGKAMGLILISVFTNCEDGALGKAKKAGGSKLAVERSKIKKKGFN